MASSTEWTLITLKEHFETLLRERERAIKAASKASQIEINKADARLDEILQAFPQEYVRKDELDKVRSVVDTIRTDHVQRREFDGLKDEQSQGRGARIALVAASGIMLALITVALGSMYANQLTHKDVSEQISIESPWLADRPTLEEDIHLLQQQVVLLKTQLAAHEAEDRVRAAVKK